MDKKKKIEEMASIIDDCTWVTDENYCENISCEKCHAIRLYNAGYRKIPEGAVVLTKEELAKVSKEVLLEVSKRLEVSNSDNPFDDI